MKPLEEIHLEYLNRVGYIRGKIDALQKQSNILEDQEKLCLVFQRKAKIVSFAKVCLMIAQKQLGNHVILLGSYLSIFGSGFG